MSDFLSRREEIERELAAAELRQRRNGFRVWMNFSYVFLALNVASAVASLSLGDPRLRQIQTAMLCIQFLLAARAFAMRAWGF